MDFFSRYIYIASKYTSCPRFVNGQNVARKSPFWLQVGSVTLTFASCCFCSLLVHNGLPQGTLPYCLNIKLKSFVQDLVHLWMATDILQEIFARVMDFVGLPWWLSGKRLCLHCRRHCFDAWVAKIPWRRKWQPTLVFLPGKSHG